MRLCEEGIGSEKEEDEDNWFLLFPILWFFSLLYVLGTAGKIRT